MEAPMQHCENFTKTSEVQHWMSEAFNTTLANFLRWCQKSGLKLSAKVRIGRDGSCSEYGMTATDDIINGECLFAIPRSMLLYPGNCSIFRVFEKDPLKSKSGWTELLIALMYEYTNPESKWKPYFELVPNFKKLDLPMFWPKNDRDDLLRGTGVSEAVDRDLDNISTEFHDVVLPYINRHKEIQWHGTLHKELKFYKQMVAFVMAYSFTENSQDGEEEEEGEGQTEATPPMMVPMADILNHVAKNNAHLSFEKEFLKMVATKDIRKGEEVYNTYGELANWHLLHMYGFAEEYPLNHYDTVDIPCDCIKKAASPCKVNKDDVDLLNEKFDYLKEMGLLGEECSYILGMDGILTDEEFKSTVKVLVMSKSEFESYKENEGWSSEEEEGEGLHDLSSYEKIGRLSLEWRQILQRSASECMDCYNSTLEADEQFLKSLESSKVNTRKLYSFYTAYGQKKILQKLINACKGR